MGTTRPKIIGAAEFKARCLRILDEIDSDGLVITKHGRPVARLVPYDLPPDELIGCMKGRIEVVGDIMSTGIRWHAEHEDGPDAQP